MSVSELRVNKITHTAGVGTITTNADGMVVTGIVTANSFSGTFTGDGSNLSGLASREVYGFTGIGKSLSLTTTNSGADNIDNANTLPLRRVLLVLQVYLSV